MIYKDEVFQIVGCAMKVHNSLGFGLHEKPYENALTVEFNHCHIRFEQQKHFSINYRNTKVGEFIPDLIAFDKIIIDTKTIDQITDRERGQMLNYLRISNLQLGLLINFKNPRIEWERIVLTQQ